MPLRLLKKLQKMFQAPLALNTWKWNYVYEYWLCLWIWQRYRQITLCSQI